MLGPAYSPHVRWLLAFVLATGCGSKERNGSAAAGSGSSVVVVKRVGSVEIDLEGWKQRCDQGHVEECELLANQYSIANDPALVTRSVEIFERICAAKSLLGCYASGIAYLDGKGVPQDAAKGRELIKQGCDLGHHWSCERLKQP